jgi:aminoglycoside 6'-N-acetyltransferase
LSSAEGWTAPPHRRLAGVDAPTLKGERVSLRAFTASDAERIAEINAMPEVARWWRPRSPSELAEEVAIEDVAAWVVEVDGELVGFVQAYEEADPEFRHAGLDLFLHPDVHGRGLGRGVVRTVVHHLVDSGHHRIVIDPALANERAIATYEAVGFRRVGVLRKYWWDHVEGRWADGLLLDLLADELR